MVDVAEAITGPPAVDQQGTLTIWWVPALTDPTAPKASTEVGGAGAFRVTYSFTPDGWVVNMPQDKIDDPRLTATQVPQSLGQIKPTMDDLKYVKSSQAGSADVVLATTSTLSGFFVERRGITNPTLAAAAQKCRVLAVTLGPQQEGPSDGNGKWTRTQPVVVTAVYNNATMAA